MTTWQNLRVNSVFYATNFLKKIRHLFFALFDVKARCSFIRNVFYLYPAEYIRAQINTDTIRLSHICNEHILSSSVIVISEIQHDSDEQSLPFILEFSMLPLHILIDVEDIDYRVFSLKHTKWWDRYGLFNQIKKTEFGKTDWVCTEHVPTIEDEERYVFMHIEPSSELLKGLIYLQSHGNPVINIQISSVQQTIKAINSIYASNPNHVFCPWVIFIKKISSREWLLTAQHQGAIILSRRGNFPANHSIAESDQAVMFKEIATTLRYLKRNAYKEDETFTLITAGFPGTFNLTEVTDDMLQKLPIADAHTTPTQDIGQGIESCMHLPHESIYTHLLNRMKSAVGINPPALYRKGFRPRIFLPQRSAYWGSFIGLRLFSTAIFICFSLTLWHCIEALHINAEINRFEHRKIALSQTTQDTEHMHKATFFNHYQHLKGLNPLHFLKLLPNVLGNETQINHFTWSCYRKDDQWQSKFQATLTLPVRLFHERRKNLIQKSYQKYKQRISTKLSNHTKASVTWTPTTHKRMYTIGVTWK